MSLKDFIEQMDRKSVIWTLKQHDLVYNYRTLDLTTGENTFFPSVSNTFIGQNQMFSDHNELN